MLFRSAWEGTGPVRGIAFGQLQADVLKQEGVTARNMAAWLAGQQRLAQGRPLGDDESFRLVRGGLLIVDEAQLAGTDYVDVQISMDGATAEVNDHVRGLLGL